LPTPYSRDNYETWYEIEKSIRKFDRIFNKVEKFDGRKFSDPENHERRESRMNDRKKTRWVDNYTYFFGGLTAEEQQYRDYFQTDLENDPEDDFVEGEIDKLEMASQGALNPKKYDFVEAGLVNSVIENFEDVVEDKIFKYKYRLNEDGNEVYSRRMHRVAERFMERALTRDESIDQDLFELYQKDSVNSSVAQSLLDGDKWETTALNSTSTTREYMAREGVQQYRDYYETEAEEQGFFEYLDNLSNRDRIRFMEIFDDLTVDKTDAKEFALIKKREFNPELSAFSNLLLDLTDFKDRVRPLARDIALLDVSRKHQRRPAVEVEEVREEYMRTLKRDAGEKVSPAAESVEEGYSSREIAAESEGEHAASPDLEAAA